MKPISFESTMMVIICIGWFVISLLQNHQLEAKQEEIKNLEAQIAILKEENQLDPCPVCDGHNTHIIHDEEYDISIKCDDCGTTFGFYQDLDDALAIWNNVKG